MKTEQLDILEELKALDRACRPEEETLQPLSFSEVAHRHRLLLDDNVKESPSGLLGSLPLSFRERHPQAVRRRYATAAVAAILVAGGLFLLSRPFTAGGSRPSGELITELNLPPQSRPEVRTPIHPLQAPPQPSPSPVAVLSEHSGIPDATPITPATTATPAADIPPATPPAEELLCVVDLDPYEIHNDYDGMYCNAWACDTSAAIANIHRALGVEMS